MLYISENINHYKPYRFIHASSLYIICRHSKKKIIKHTSSLQLYIPICYSNLHFAANMCQFIGINRFNHNLFYVKRKLNIDLNYIINTKKKLSTKHTCALCIVREGLTPP